MVITELTVTESSVDTSYAALCPTEGNLVGSERLRKILQQLCFTPHSERYVKVRGTELTIDKANVTNIAVTVIR